MNLPIEILPGQPRRFRWKQTFTTPVGTRTMEHTGPLPLNLDENVAALIAMCKQLMAENADLKATISGMAERIGAQSELLTKAAEKHKNERAAHTSTAHEDRQRVKERGKP